MNVVAVFAIVGVHLKDPANTFFVASGGVKHLAALVQTAAVDPEIDELAYVGVGHDFERQRRKGLAGIWVAF